MTSLEKASNLGYLFITFKPEKNPSMHAPLSSACIGMFQFIQKSVFYPNICTLNLDPLTGTINVNQVNCPIWGLNNSEGGQTGGGVARASRPLLSYQSNLKIMNGLYLLGIFELHRYPLFLSHLFLDHRVIFSLQGVRHILLSLIHLHS